MINYPELHSLFLICFFSNKKEHFKDIFFKNLISDKNNRKQRFYQLGKQFSFFSIKSLNLDNLDIFSKVVDDLFEISPNDNFLVEKSYYLLDNAISLAKKEGQDQIKEYVLSDSYLYQIILKDYANQWNVMIITHQVQDFKMKSFEIKFQSIQDYCLNYRSDQYRLSKELQKKYNLLKDIDLI